MTIGYPAIQPPLELQLAYMTVVLISWLQFAQSSILRAVHPSPIVYLRIRAVHIDHPCPLRARLAETLSLLLPDQRHHHVCHLLNGDVDRNKQRRSR